MTKSITLLAASMALSAGLFAESAGDAASSLSHKQRSIVSIAAFTAGGELEALEGALSSGLDAGLTVNESGEILLQMYAYAGFPRSLNGLATLRTVLQRRLEKGIKDAPGKLPSPQPAGVDKYALGRENINRLTGSRASQPKPEGLGYDQAIDVFLKEHLFADIVGRDNLEFPMRELATVGALCALPGTNPQLASHMSGAMNLGITEGQMRDLVATVGATIGEKAERNAALVLGQVLSQRGKAPARTQASAPAQASAAAAMPSALFPRGNRAVGGNFTGAYWVSWLVPFDGGLKNPVASVTFEPGARTNWHSHEGGQILLVTEGRGYYQEDGKPARELKPGDVAPIGIGVRHWHGAAPDSWFAHIAIEANPGAGATTWMGPVSDAEYSYLR